MYIQKNLVRENYTLKDKYLYFAILLIGFQQFPVLRIGGSFKLYELLAIGALIYDCLNLSRKSARDNSIERDRQTKRISFGLLIFFVVSPTISYIIAILFNDYPNEFFIKYPAEYESFRFNYYLFPLLTLVYMFFNYSVFVGIVNSDWVFSKFGKIIQYTIYFGTFIAMYALFAIFIYDIVAALPEFIQNKKAYIMRTNGFSQEPGAYVLYQAWIVLFTFFSKEKFNKKSIWLLLLSINVIALIATFSTTLVALIAIILISFFVFKTSSKVKIYITISILAVIMVSWIVAVNSLNYEYIETFFINKVTNFFSAPDHTLDSGSFRSYTSRIGIEIFKNFPFFGVGVGDSVYYMHYFENKMGIATFGETLFAGSFPQNTFSIILSEQGVLGFVFFIYILFKLGYIFWMNRNKDTVCKMFFIGFFFNLATLITIAPVYSLFLWVFPALGLGYVLRLKAKGSVNINTN